MGTYHYALFSGGLESTYALAKALNSHPENRITPIHIDYGQYASSYERTAVNGIIKLLHTSDIIRDRILPPVFMDIGKIFPWTASVAYTGNIYNFCPEIENRNMVLFSILYSYLLSRVDLEQANEFVVFTGFKDGEMPDANTNYFGHLSTLCKEYKPNQTLSIILVPKDTRDNIRHYLCTISERFGINADILLALLSSCYAPVDNRPCNVCYKCKTDREISKKGTMGDWG